MRNVPEATVDWPAIERLAAALGLHTRTLAANRDAAQLTVWARQMAREDTGPRAATYLELAALAGPEPDTKDKEAA